MVLDPRAAKASAEQAAANAEFLAAWEKRMAAMEHGKKLNRRERRALRRSLPRAERSKVK